MSDHPVANFYEPELDVLRFCAFLAVFASHALPDDYGALVPRWGHVIPALLQAIHDAMSFGVCIFFLLSSYLITKLLTIERAATGAVHLKNFYIRRVLRIWPLYLGFLLLMWVLSNPRLHLFFVPIETGRLLAFLFFSGNIYTGLFGFTLNPILPLWTVSIEEQFYILWPAIARKGSVFLRRASWTVLAISVVAAYLLARSSSNPTHVLWTSSLVQFQFFALGALVALRFAKRLPSFSPAARAGLLTGGVALLVLAAGWCRLKSTGSVPAGLLTIGYELTAVGVVLILLAFLGAARGRHIPNALTYLGKISYGLYVFHDLSLVVSKYLADRFHIHHGFRAGSAAAMTLVLAMLSYRFFEKPFLILKDRFSLIHSRRPEQASDGLDSVAPRYSFVERPASGLSPSSST